jgi:hypothetical protein
MYKVTKAMRKYVHDVLTNISENENIDMEVLEQYIEESKEEKKRCKGMLKNGTQCHHHTYKNLDVCLKHKYNEYQESNKSKTVRCEATNRNGTRCIRNATADDPICGLHKFWVSSPQKSASSCIYYEEEDDDIHICKQPVTKNIWFCKKHEHHQHVYMHMYKARSISEYKSKIQNGEIDKHVILERILKELVA